MSNQLTREQIIGAINTLKEKCVAPTRLGVYFVYRCCDGWTYEELIKFDGLIRQCGVRGVYWCTWPPIEPGRRYIAT